MGTFRVRLDRPCTLMPEDSEPTYISKSPPFAMSTSPVSPPVANPASLWSGATLDPTSKCNWDIFFGCSMDQTYLFIIINSFFTDFLHFTLLELFCLARMK